MARVENDQPTTTVTPVEVTCGDTRAVARPDQPVVIGRDDDCQIVLDEPAVSRRHAEVAWADDGWVVRDLDSTNGIWRDGVRALSFPVGDGLEVRLGSPDRGPVLSVRAASVPAEPPAAAPDPLPGAPSTTSAVAQPSTAPAQPASVPAAPARDAAAPVESAPAARRPAAVAGRTQAAEYDATGKVRIGRAADNDIVLSDLRVSSHHAELRRSGDDHLVVDLGTRNGTYLNGTPIRREKIQPGDMISIGRHEDRKSTRLNSSH